MRSVVDICNQALGAIGVSMFIQGLNENSLEAIVCKQFYEQARDQALEDFPWNFADSYTPLQDIGSPVPGWAYRYAYPNDCQKAREVMLAIPGIGLDRHRSSIRFAVIEDESDGGRAIAANLAGATLHYTKRVENPALYSAKFVDALAFLLASKIAAPLAAKPEYAKTARAAYDQAIINAGASNLNEGKEPQEQESEFLRARL